MTLEERLTHEKQAHAETRERLENARKAVSKQLTDYMGSGMRAGFIFGVSPSGVTVEHDPETSLELVWTNAEDATGLQGRTP